jgi:hypothetical protein
MYLCGRLLGYDWPLSKGPREKSSWRADFEKGKGNSFHKDRLTRISLFGGGEGVRGFPFQT